MRRLITPFLLFGLLSMFAACGEVTSDPDGPPGTDAPPGPTIDAPPAPIDAPPPAGCGDGVVNGSESCDDGANNGVYGYCNGTCSGPGARCGDGSQNGPEACDSGANNGQYGYCNATCSALGPRCGDGAQNGPEACDSGGNNGSYGYCNATCTAQGPRCGDGVQNGPEACDSGGNNGQYGFCNATCTALGPRCGDNQVNGPEACDNGAQNGTYGYCNATCSALGPRCGDNITNGPEQCDQGTVYSQNMAAGVCRPDCAGTVQQKSIGVTARTLQRGGIAGLDGLCQSTFGSSYRAMAVDGSTRIASASPNAGNGQVGWVLGAYTRYVSAETGNLVFITDNSRLIGASGGTDQPLVNAVRATDDGYGAWTGANADWTSGLDCADWTSASSSDQGLGCNAATTAPAGFPNNGGVSQCQYDRRFYCVQQ